MKIFYFIALFFLSNEIYAKSIDATLKDVGKKGQSLLFAALPIFILSIAYLYKRGKTEAKERTENLVIGAVLASTAFGWAYFFGQ